MEILWNKATYEEYKTRKKESGDTVFPYNIMCLAYVRTYEHFVANSNFKKSNIAETVLNNIYTDVFDELFSWDDTKEGNSFWYEVDEYIGFEDDTHCPMFDKYWETCPEKQLFDEASYKNLEFTEVIQEIQKFITTSSIHES